MVSPFVGGGTLASRMKRGPWNLDEAIAVLESLAAALDYAHSERIVHRDIKPSNVLFTDRGRLVLSDFGIARILEASTLLSHAGLIIGTPMYMSPEQADGQIAGPASDLYSLGVVAYEIMTGRPPFTAETPLALLRAHIDKPLPPPRLLNPGLPAAVEAALFVMLAKEPTTRFRSGADFISRLRSDGGSDETSRSSQTIDSGTTSTTKEPAARKSIAKSASTERPSPTRSRVPLSRRAGIFIGAILAVSLGVLLGTLAASKSYNFDGSLVGPQSGSITSQEPVMPSSVPTTPTPTQLQARCVDAALRFPTLNLNDKRGSVAAGYRENGVDVDLPQAGGARLTSDQAEQVLGGWIAISLLMERSGQEPPTLDGWLDDKTDGSTLANAIQAGRRVDGMITIDEWSTMRAWPATNCEGAFLQAPANNAVVNMMERVVVRSVATRAPTAIGGPLFSPSMPPPTPRAVEPTVAPASSTPIVLTVGPVPTRTLQASPTLAPSSAQSGQVGNTNGQGANLRSEPGSGGRVVKILAEGSYVYVLGPERQVDGVQWRQVRDSSGVTGWIIYGAVAPAGSVSTPIPR